MPLPNPSFENNIDSWSMRCDTQGAYTASVSLTNEQSQYDYASYAFQPFELSATVSSITWGVSDPDCFSGSVTVRGIITEVQNLEDLDKKTASFAVKSYFFRLPKKVINTEKYRAGARTVLNDIFASYLNVPGTLYDFSETAENRIVGPISGNNLIDEMRRVAQAGESALFVAEDGVLRTRAWKDHNSPIDVIIPNEAIKSAQLTRNDEVGPTRINVRGAFVSNFQKGLQPHITWPDPCARGQVPMTWCLLSGIDLTCEKVSINPNIVGYPGNILGANIQVAAAGGSTVTSDGEVNKDNVIELCGNNPGTYMGPGQQQFTVNPQGFIRSPDEWTAPNSRLKALRQNQAHLARGGITHARMFLGAGPHFRGGPADGGGVRHSGGNLNNDREADEPEEIQIELVVDDPGLQAMYGVVTEQIECPYIIDKNLLFRIAVRRFQQARMEAIAWELSLAPLPCLKLNDKVQFQTPETEYGGTRTVVGLVTQIGYNYSASSSELSQQVVVQSIENLGATTYTATDITTDNSFSSIDQNDWWSGSVPPNSTITGGNGGFRITAASGESPMLYLVEHSFSVGGTYTVTFAIDEISGARSLQFSVVDLSSNVLLSPVSHTSSGTYSYTFTVTANTSVQLGWGIVGGSGAGVWTLYELSISQTVTA